MLDTAGRTLVDICWSLRRLGIYGSLPIYVCAGMELYATLLEVHQRLHLHQSAKSFEDQQAPRPSHQHLQPIRQACKIRIEPRIGALILLEFYFMSDSRPFAQFHILDCATVDGEAECGANLMEAIAPCSTRIEVQ